MIQQSGLETEKRKHNVVTLLWVRRNLVIGTFLLCCVFWAFFLSLNPAYFKANAIIAFEQKEQDIRTIKSASDLKPLTETFKEEEKLIRSQNVLLPVIRKLDLAHRPEFNPDSDPKKSKVYLLGKALNSMMNIKNPDFTDEGYLYMALNQGIAVNIVNQQEIHISYSGISPYLSRSIINTIANEYLQQTSPNGSKKLLSNTKDLPDNALIPDLQQKIITALCISALISLMVGITTPLPKNESTSHAS